MAQSENPTQDQELRLTPELKAWIESVRPLTADQTASLERAGQKLDESPSFQASTLKGVFIEEMLAALVERNESQADLARRLGKSRQYIHQIFKGSQRANFTVDTMCAIAQELGKRLDLVVRNSGERIAILRCAPLRREDFKFPSISMGTNAPADADYCASSPAAAYKAIPDVAPIAA